MRRVLVALLPVLLVVGYTEPARDDDGRLPVHPVEGRLVVGDQIAFHPVAGGTHRPVAMTGPNGGFRLTTYAVGDGAPAGEYVVTVFWENELMPLEAAVAPTPPPTIG